MIGRFLRALVYTVAPKIHKPEDIINKAYSEGNSRNISATVWGISGFHREYGLCAERCVVQEYAQRGTTVTLTKKSGKIFLELDKQPGLWMMWVTTRAANRRLERFFLTRMSELTGKPEKQIKAEFKRINATLILHRKPSDGALRRVAKVWGQHSIAGHLKDPRLFRLIWTAAECDYCDFDVTDEGWWLKVHGTLGYNSDYIVHMLLCRAERRRVLQKIFENEDFRKNTSLAGASQPTLGSTWARRVSYSTADLESLCQLIDSKELSNKHLEYSLDYYGVIFRPEEYAELKELTEGKDQIDPWVVTAYYHRGVPIGNIRCVDAFVSSGKASFYDARALAEAGVLPEFAEIVPAGWSVQEILGLHKLVERFGLEAVQESLLKFDNNFSQVVGHWHLRTRYPDLSWAEILELLRQQELGARPIRGREQVHQSNKRRAQLVEVVQTVEEIVTWERTPRGLEMVWYSGVSASDLPVMSGRMWLRVLTQCGWAPRSRVGTHLRLGKDQYQITFIDCGKRISNRYSIYGNFRRGRVPESELIAVVQACNGHR